MWTFEAKYMNWSKVEYRTVRFEIEHHEGSRWGDMDCYMQAMREAFLHEQSNDVLVELRLVEA